MKRETILKDAQTLTATVTRNVPLVGIFAFALASVWSLFQMFNDNALHPTPLYWIPAGLVEVVTAWLVYQAVESLRIITDTKSPKRDRRFHAIVAGTCVVLAMPTLAVSYTANRYEFQGDAGLASLFPISCVACAVASAIPHVKARTVDARLEQKREALRKEREKTRAAKAEIEQYKAEVVRLNAEFAQKRAMSEPSREVFNEICTDGNGNAPGDARAVNKLLNDSGFYSVPDSTARSWAR